MKTCCAIAAMAVMAGMAFRSLAQPPLVYALENTGASSNYPAPPLPVLANLPVIQPLPDPFAWATNSPALITRSTYFSDWEHHRNQFKAQIENYEIGTKPAVDPANIFASYTVVSATSGTLTVRVTNVVNGTARTLTLSCGMTLPAGPGPFPVIIGMNSPNGSISLGGRAIATITYIHDQATTYGAPSNLNPYYKLYASPNNPALDINNTGQYSAWAWGVSRIIDGLYLLNGMLGTNQINLQRIGVTGCSYAGKMALFCGAFDERIALTIPQESGGGGAPNWRYSWQMEPVGSVEGLGQTDHNWFSEGMFAFAGDGTSKLPEDHHMLMSMVAPRALFVTGNPDGAVWLSNPSCYVSCKAVELVYTNFGISDRFGYNINGGKPHCALTADVTSDVGAFLDKFLMGIANLNTVTNRHVPSTYTNINAARWTVWWGTTNPIFPYSAKLTLTMPGAATEGDGTLAGQGIVSINPLSSNDVVSVNLISSNTNKVIVPGSVVIPAGQSNAVFNLTVVDNATLDADQLATITASSSLCTNGPQSKQITIHDNETTTLAVSMPASASESAGLLLNAGTITLGAPAGTNINIALSSSDSSTMSVASIAHVSTGQTSGSFSPFTNDKKIYGGSTKVTVTAHVPNWPDGSNSITILFDDSLPNLAHFTVTPVPSPQVIAEPFPVTITARDGANNMLDYRLPVALSTLVAGNAAGANTILNSPSPEQSLTDGNELVLGYSFTPGTNLKVTHVRHYFGDKVSLWTGYGTLLASQNVASVPGTWVDTPLPTPLVLSAGDTYVVTVHENGVEYFWSGSLPGTFADGTISQSW